MGDGGRKRIGKEEAGAASEKKQKKDDSQVAAEAAGDLDSDDLGDVQEDSEEEIVEDAGDDEDDEEKQAGGDEGSRPEEQTGLKQKRVWRPGVDEIADGEQLDAAPGTYHMLHRGQLDWPCLSFDVLRDELGAHRTSYPMTAYVVAGTQAKDPADNRICMMKWSNLHKTDKGDQNSDSEDEESSDSAEDQEVHMEQREIAHPGGVNRIRAMPQAGHVVATWADTGKVHVWNLQEQRRSLDKRGEKLPLQQKPIHSCQAHAEEGFAMDFNSNATGHFLSGSNDASILHWEPVQGGWNVSADRAFKGHTASVEDVQWKRTGTGVKDTFASCSSDCTVCIWDVREKSRSKPAARIAEAHSADVNVLSWSPCVGELLLTGSDDGGFKIWDVRHLDAGPMANFLWHRKPVTSVDWHPTDETVLAVACADNSVSLWDMAVEDDRGAGVEEVPGESHFPAQLLFLHMGQKDPKEVRWHPQIPGVCICTAASGFNVFKTCNI